MESAKIIIIPGKAPFHYGLFFGAMRHYLGEPTDKVNIGASGFYDYYWEMTKELKKKLEHGPSLIDIGNMMGCFDLKWPESRCDIGRWQNSPNRDAEYLRITVSHTLTNAE